MGADLVAIADSLESHLAKGKILDRYRDYYLFPLNFTAAVSRDLIGNATGVGEKLGLRAAGGSYDEATRRNTRKFVFGRAFVVPSYELQKASMVAGELCDQLQILLFEWSAQCAPRIYKIDNITTSPRLEQDQNLVAAILTFKPPTGYSPAPKAQFWVAKAIIGFEMTYN